jgi:hypothetical protein
MLKVRSLFIQQLALALADRRKPPGMDLDVESGTDGQVVNLLGLLPF